MKGPAKHGAKSKVATPDQLSNPGDEATAFSKPRMSTPLPGAFVEAEG
jgi:hypothetical protein